jgi:diguanylate cyclase (GGDEF)-like protein
MTSWTLLFGASIVLCVVVLFAATIRDIGRQIHVVETERDGLTTTATLRELFEDASAYRAGGCAMAPIVEGPTVARDVAALDDAEAAHPFGSDTWNDIRENPQASNFIARLTALFPIVSDRSGLTYDPDIAGVDLADAMTHRLPVAIEQLQRIQLILCARDAAAVPRRFAIAGDIGTATAFVDDGLREIREAGILNDQIGLDLDGDRGHAERSSAAAMLALSAFDETPTAAHRARAEQIVRDAVADLYRLLRHTAPSLRTQLDARRDDLDERRLLAIILGTIAVLGAAAIVVFGTRSAQQRAELAGVRNTARELEFHATHDALTGLPNRVAFMTGVDTAIARLRADPAGGTIAVLFIDLDDFKLVNDSLGHQAGDDVIIFIARRLECIANDSGDALLARFGGDEFAMMLAAKNGEIAATTDRAIAAIASAMADPIKIDAQFDRGFVISASVGVTTYSPEGRDRTAPDLLREADAAMYEAKAGGRARAETFGPALIERATRKLTLASDMRGATDRGEFVLAFQPFVRLTDSKRLGSEALLRWQHPKFGLLMPGAFLPIAEETGSMVEIGRWMLEEAIRLYAAGVAPGDSVHANVSVSELLDNRLDTFITELLEKYKVPPSSLAIELVEGSLIRAGDRAEKMMRRLRAMGVKIWIDDFGVEYSSLRYLQQLPIDGVKIDRTFVGSAEGSLGSRPIVKAILDLSRSLALGVVAEGIETNYQRTELLALGCTMGQGYLFRTIETPTTLVAKRKAR